MYKITAGILLCIFYISNLKAQEMVMPLKQNTAYNRSDIKPFSSIKLRASLPFIDDFSYEGPYPDASLWQDNKAFINNTMSGDPITRGVATLDGLNQFGRPYYPQPFNSGVADSLTSVPIDLSLYDSSDHIYLSFYYQPQGLGFAPEINDSLFLFFKNTANQWVRVWEIRGTNYQGFKFVILPVMEAQYLHNDFQFRFVNIASMNINDDVWNLDYIKMDVNRTDTDSIMNDLAFSIDATSILKNYYSMPYRHFIANQTNEKSLNHTVVVNNLNTVPNTITINLEAKELYSNTPVNNQILTPASVAAKSFLQQTLNSYNISYTAPNPKSKVVIRNKYYYPSIASTGRKQNDTLINDAVFDNYFAYDDGSAEKSYFLLPAVNFPSKTALSFYLNEPDTLRGLMVHFGAQVPTALGKYFSIVLYKSLGSLGQTDSIILQEDLFKVQYEPSYNGFSTYALTNPPLLASGSYYIGITQPANFGSDSIYYGLDVNQNTNLQHLAYNVEGIWYSSTVAGSLMMRPMVGQAFTPTMVRDVENPSISSILVYPNPTADLLHIQSNEGIQKYRIYALDGTLMEGNTVHNNLINMCRLPAGEYIVVLIDSKGKTIAKKINKL